LSDPRNATLQAAQISATGTIAATYIVQQRVKAQHSLRLVKIWPSKCEPGGRVGR